MLASAQMPRSPARSTVVSLVVMAALAGLKLALVAAQPLRGISTAGFDDALFVELTRTLIHSNWLGDYTNLTLAKGPGAPLVFATFWSLGVPLPIAQQLLYAAACLLVVLALAPVERRRTVLVAIFALLLFNPVTFDAAVMTRISRSMVYASAILASIAAHVGLASWNARSRHARAAWAASAGLATGLAWITREETVMLFPALALIAGGCAIWIGREPGHGSTATYLSGLAVSAVVSLALVGTIALVNYANYGAFVVTEIRGGPFARAYGALARIPPHDEAQEIAMTEEARRTVYAASPSFRELEPVLEGARGDYWIAESKFFVGLPAHGRGLHRAWFLWALRDAAQLAGHHASADEASRYYARLAQEVNDACANPSLGCSDPQSSPMPPMNRGPALPVAPRRPESWRFPLTPDHLPPWSPASIGDADGLDRFAEIARWPVLPTEAPPHRGLRLQILEYVGRSFAVASPLLSLSTMLAFVAALSLSIGRRKLSVELVLAAGSLALATACITVVAMVDALAFPAVNMLYLAPAYPAVGLFWCSSSLALFRLLADRGRAA